MQKPNGQIRVWIDPKNLNKVLKRSHHLNLAHKDILPELARAEVFSTEEAKNGFCHFELDDYISHLTFNSPITKILLASHAL